MAAREVISRVPTPTTAEGKGQLIERALELAGEICDADRESFSVSQAALSVAVDDRALLARAIELMADLLDERSETPPRCTRCFWCWLAAGQTAEAWSALPRLSIDETREHGLICPHRPGAPAINAIALELVKLINQTVGGKHPPTLAQLYSATLALSEAKAQLSVERQIHAEQTIEMIQQLAPPSEG